MRNWPSSPNGSSIRFQARQGTRVDVGFQSLAGTSKGLAGMVGLDVEGIAELAGGFSGLYFETGQGLEVTNAAREATHNLEHMCIQRRSGVALGGRPHHRQPVHP